MSPDRRRTKANPKNVGLSPKSSRKDSKRSPSRNAIRQVRRYRSRSRSSEKKPRGRGIDHTNDRNRDNRSREVRRESYRNVGVNQSRVDGRWRNDKATVNRQEQPRKYHRGRNERNVPAISRPESFHSRREGSWRGNRRDPIDLISRDRRQGFREGRNARRDPSPEKWSHDQFARDARPVSPVNEARNAFLSISREAEKEFGLTPEVLKREKQKREKRLAEVAAEREARRAQIAIEKEAKMTQEIAELVGEERKKTVSSVSSNSDGSASESDSK